ncbi:MAG: AmmeMemoRadiSam system protein B [Deltaproteobacteria bacterium]|nr:AmmeMemoRadiSam system protein B [Deltaproteobacteria bacterium]
MKEDVRKPAVAGSFYPAEAQTLSRQVKEFLAQASKKEIRGDIIALVSPHAGYMYSGQVAAHSFKLVQGMKFDAVVVVAPSHRVAFQGASVYDRGGYQTPLGVLPVEKDLCQKLMQESNVIRFLPQAHGAEHSLEVQLPFLQEVLGEFPLVPVVIGDQSFPTCEKVGQAIARTVQGKKVLLVASTDLSHFHSYDEAVKLDQGVMKGIERFDPQRLSADLEAGKGEACGGGAVVAVMVAAKELGANRAQVLKYMNSGDVTGDRSGVVGYAAAVFYREGWGEEKEKGPRKAGISLGLSEGEKKTLRQIAQATIEGRLKKEKPPKIDSLTATLREKRGAFVSLHKQGRLRGCIGLIQPSKPLHQSVEQMAAAAAFDDPRFPPVSLKELKDLEIEISVLTPLTRMKEVHEIEVGKHGLYIKKGFYSGLLLPQVATEYNWDRATFLEETCRKAGLHRNAWKDPDAEIYLFSADIF